MALCMACVFLYGEMSEGLYGGFLAALAAVYPSRCRLAVCRDRPAVSAMLWPCVAALAVLWRDRVGVWRE